MSASQWPSTTIPRQTMAQMSDIKTKYYNPQEISGGLQGTSGGLQKPSNILEKQSVTETKPINPNPESTEKPFVPIIPKSPPTLTAKTELSNIQRQREDIQRQDITRPITLTGQTFDPSASTSYAKFKEFFNSGTLFLSQNENYSAIMSLALAANTLQILQNQGIDVSTQLKGDAVFSGWLIKSNQTEMSATDIVLSILLSKIESLKASIVEIRGALGSGISSETSSSSVPSKETDARCSELMSRLQIMWTKDMCTNICFERIIGLDDAKEQLRNGFVYPLLYPNLFGSLSKGLLLYGMPGTGKTLLAKAAVTELYQLSQGAIDVVMLAPGGGDLKSKYFGESEQQIKNIFECASLLACNRSKLTGRRTIAIIFIDEIDSIANSRDSSEDDNSNAGGSGDAARSTTNALLQAMDGVQSSPNVVVMAATNYPDKIDKAIGRRLQTAIMIDLPNTSDIAIHLKQNLTKMITGISTGDKLADYCKNKSELSTKSTNPDKMSDYGSCSDEDKQTCQKGIDQSVWKDWSDSPYFQQLTDEAINAIAIEMEQKHYSSADVDIVFNLTRQAAGNVARKQGMFIVGPFIKEIDKRVFVPVSGISDNTGNIVWSDVAEISNKVSNYEEEMQPSTSLSTKLTVSSSSSIINYDPGKLVLLQNKSNDVREIVLGTSERFINTNDLESFSFVPDDLGDIGVQDIFVQVDANGKQITDSNDSGILFHFTTNLKQGTIENRAINLPAGISSRDNEWNIIRKLQTQSKLQTTVTLQLNNVYFPTKEDQAHYFIRTTVAKIRELYHKSREPGFIGRIISYVYERKDILRRTEKEDIQKELVKNPNMLINLLITDSSNKLYASIGSLLYEINTDNVNTSIKDILDNQQSFIIHKTIDQAVPNISKFITGTYLVTSGGIYERLHRPFGNQTSGESVGTLTIKPQHDVASLEERKRITGMMDKNERFVSWNVVPEMFFETVENYNSLSYKEEMQNSLNLFKSMVK